MDRTDFITANGTIDMNRALAAGRQARADAAKSGATGFVSLFRSAPAQKRGLRALF